MADTKSDSLRMRDLSPTGVRLPPELKKRVAEAAAANNRSISAEIVARVEKSFEVADEWENALENINDALGRIERLEREMQDLQHHTGFRDY